MRFACPVALALLALLHALAAAESRRLDDPITIESRYVRLMLDGTGRTVGLVDRATGRDYAAMEAVSFVSLRRGGANAQPVRVRRIGSRLDFAFAGPPAMVSVRIRERGTYLVFELETVKAEGIEELVFCGTRVTLNKHVSDISGVASDGQFACALRVLDPKAGFRLEGGPTPTLSAICSPKLKLVGAKVALVGCPVDKLRTVLKEVARREGILYSPLGGPFALDAEETRGSYVFAAGLSEANVDQWARLCKGAGIVEAHLISWEKSLGHYEPNPSLFPHGAAGLKAVVDKIHAAGLKAGMHTLTGLIGQNDAFITPIPDKRLGTDAAFTLTSAISVTDTVLTTSERPHDLDTIWAYGSRGNVLRIDDELIQYDAYSDKAPYGFSRCHRGAFGTRPQAHALGAAVSHLAVYAGCFLPGPDTTLIDEIAADIAAIYNGCGFDMIYMDGAEGTPGGWYGVARMRAAIFQRLKRRALVEASEWGYHSWPFHSRVGAWDYPNWGLKRFLDLHCRSNEEVRQSALLPAQLGWWSIFGPNEDRYAELPDEVEYLCCKSLAFDMPMSFQGFGLSGPENERQDEYLATIGRYEKLRLSRYFPDSVLSELRKPGQDFHLVSRDTGEWSMEPADYLAHSVTGREDGSGSWSFRNRFGTQPVKLRIQALYSAAPYDSPGGQTLTDFSGALPSVESAPTVTGALSRTTEHVQTGAASGRFAAKGAAGWARAAFAYTPNRDLSKCGALGVWVYGDGKGEALNLQLTNPVQFWPTFDEHYITVDFTGWRYFELHLRERDAERYGDYAWPYGDAYSVYRNPLIRSNVNALNLYMNNLPAGREAVVLISPVRALPTIRTSLANPALTINGRRIVFPVTLESGQYLEFSPPSDCRLYDERGKLVSRITPQGDAPQAVSGDNQARFTCESAPGATPRARVTVTLSGEPLPSR